MSSLSDAKAKTTKITLNDGVEREIRFTLNAMAEMEDRYGSVDAAFEALDSNSIKAVRFVLWAGLMHTDEGLTEKQVGNLIDIQLMNEIMSTMSEAMQSDLPAPGETVPNA